MGEGATQFVLTLSCPDRPGIVGAVSSHLAAQGSNILEAQQFGDAQTGQFFMRLVFRPCTVDVAADDLRAGFKVVA